jgi:hypothetical protein
MEPERATPGNTNQTPQIITLTTASDAELDALAYEKKMIEQLAVRKCAPRSFLPVGRSAVAQRLGF